MKIHPKSPNSAELRLQAVVFLGQQPQAADGDLGRVAHHGLGWLGKSGWDMGKFMGKSMGNTMKYDKNMVEEWSKKSGKFMAMNGI